MGSSGWNKPSAANQPRKAPKKPSVMRGIAAGLVVVAAAAAVFFFIFSGDSGKVEIKKAEKAKRIKEVTPAPAPKTPTNKVEVAKSGMKQLEDGRWMLYKDGVAQWRNPRRFSKYGATTSRMDRAQMSLEAQTFKNHADQTLARLYRHPRGMPYMMWGGYQRFDKFFAESLKTPIIIEPTDSEEVKLMKEGVIESRKYLKAEMDAGRDISEIVRGAMQELHDLGEYRREVLKEVERVAQDTSLTEKDLQECMAAANEMLEKKGIVKAKLPGRILMHRKILKEKEAAEAAAAQQEQQEP